MSLLYVLVLGLPPLTFIRQRTTLVRQVSKQPLRMARRSTVEVFVENVEESLTRCEREDLECSTGIYRFTDHYLNWCRRSTD